MLGDASAKRGALYAILCMSFINVLNYVDRYVPSAVKDLIKSDLHLDDTETSAPLTAFIVVYMLTSPIFSQLADMGYSRKKSCI